MSKKGFLYRLTVGRDDQPDFTADKLPSTRRAQFFDIFKGRIGLLCKINILTLLFCIPAIAWIMYIGLVRAGIAGSLPFSGNLGVGYPVATGMQDTLDTLNFSVDLQLYSILIPLIALAFLGFAGMFFVIKKLSWGEESPRWFRAYFAGIKKAFFPFLIAGVLVGGALFLVMFNISGYKVLALNQWLKVGAIAVSILLALIILFAVMFWMTQAVTYNIGIGRLFKNSFAFAIGLLPRNFLIIIAAVGPILLLYLLGVFVSIFAMLVLMAIMIIGFSWICLVMTQYSHNVYDAYLNDKIGDAKHKGIYVKAQVVETAEDGTQNNAEESKSQSKKPARYQNPKKTKQKDKFIDDAVVTALPQSFDRGDLAKLADDKEKMGKELDAMDAQETHTQDG